TFFQTTLESFETEVDGGLKAKSTILTLAGEASASSGLTVMTRLATSTAAKTRRARVGMGHLLERYRGIRGTTVGRRRRIQGAPRAPPAPGADSTRRRGGSKMGPRLPVRRAASIGVTNEHKGVRRERAQWKAAVAGSAAHRGGCDGVGRGNGRLRWDGQRVADPVRHPDQAHHGPGGAHHRRPRRPDV